MDLIVLFDECKSLECSEKCSKNLLSLTEVLSKHMINHNVVLELSKRHFS